MIKKYTLVKDIRKVKKGTVFEFDNEKNTITLIKGKTIGTIFNVLKNVGISDTKYFIPVDDNLLNYETL